MGAARVEAAGAEAVLAVIFVFPPMELRISFEHESRVWKVDELWPPFRVPVVSEGQIKVHCGKRVLLLCTDCNNIPSGSQGDELDVVLTNGFQFRVFSIVLEVEVLYIVRVTSLIA